MSFKDHQVHAGGGMGYKSPWAKAMSQGKNLYGG